MSQGQPSAADGSGRRSRIRWWVTTAVAACSLGLTIVAWAVLQERERQLVAARFEVDAEERIEAIRAQFRETVGVLHAVATFYAGSQRVERAATLAHASVPARPRIRPTTRSA